jgi:hypothetical protein
VKKITFKFIIIQKQDIQKNYEMNCINDDKEREKKDKKDIF